MQDEYHCKICISLLNDAEIRDFRARLVSFFVCQTLYWAEFGELSDKRKSTVWNLLPPPHQDIIYPFHTSHNQTRLAL